MRGPRLTNGPHTPAAAPACSRLNRPERALDIVRETKSSEAAKMVAAHCLERGNHKLAIEFGVLAKDTGEAFELAVRHDALDTYAAALGKSGTLDQYAALAQAFEAKRDLARAGDIWFEAKDYAKALDRYLQCGEKLLDRAIDVVGRAKADRTGIKAAEAEKLTRVLVDYLMGEVDGYVKVIARALLPCAATYAGLRGSARGSHGCRRCRAGAQVHLQAVSCPRKLPAGGGYRRGHRAARSARRLLPQGPRAPLQHAPGAPPPQDEGATGVHMHAGRRQLGGA